MLSKWCHIIIIVKKCKTSKCHNFWFRCLNETNYILSESSWGNKDNGIIANGKLWKPKISQNKKPKANLCQTLKSLYEYPHTSKIQNTYCKFFIFYFFYFRMYCMFQQHLPPGFLWIMRQCQKLEISPTLLSIHSSFAQPFLWNR